MPSPRRARDLLIPLLLCPLFVDPAVGAAAPASPHADPLAGLAETHPRVMLTEDRLERMRAHRAADPRYRRIVERVRGYADQLLDRPPMEYELDGSTRGRLLHVSREVMRRVLSLGTLAKLDPEDPRSARYRERLIREVLTVCEFEDWGPQHFLDVAEMSFAVAIAYDWFFHELSPGHRETIRTALIDKGLRMALRPRDEGNWWITSEFNWNQVCHGGMTAAALAVGEEAPWLSRAVIRQARANIGHALASYAPDGVYPEGPGYWGYGTMYSIILADSVQTALGDGWGMLEVPGFRRSFTYQLHMISPKGWLFNYADCGLGWGANNTVKHYWLAQATDDAALMALCWEGIQPVLAQEQGGIPRDFPLVLLWYAPGDAEAHRPSTSFLGSGIVDVAAMRSAWADPEAWYLGMKGGALGGHAHLDAGVFVLEHAGVRWAHDLGAEGLTYMTAVPDRWAIYRCSNIGHNTLTIGGARHDPHGDAELVRVASVDTAGFRSARFDLSSFFPGQAESVHRTGALIDDAAVLLQDEIVGASEPVVWSMHTEAQVTLFEDRVVLEQDGERMGLWIDCDRPYELAAPPATPFESTLSEREKQNDGVTRLEIHLPAGDSALRVLFSPETQTAPVDWGGLEHGVSRFTFGGARYVLVGDEAALPLTLADGTRLLARLLVQPNDGEPRVAGGWLFDAEGAVLDSEPLAPEPALDDLARHLQLSATVGEGVTEIALSLRNLRFAESLTVSTGLAAGAGAAWQVEGDVAARVPIALGDDATLELRARAKPGLPRYPLPRLDVALAVGTDAAPRREITRVLPLTGGRPPLSLRRVAAPDLDGTLDDAVWQGAADVPVLGHIAMGQLIEPGTRVWTAYDDQALYLAFHCTEPLLAELERTAHQRDEATYSDDSVEFMFDPTGAAEHYYQVVVNSAGVIFDARGFDKRVDLPGLRVATAMRDDHWTCEIRLPWKDVGLDGPPERAGLLLCRNRHAGDEHEVFQFPVSPEGNHQPGHFARLELLEGDN